MPNETTFPANQTRHQQQISGITEFKELTKKEAQMQLSKELDKLLRTANTNERLLYKQEFKVFHQLFKKYVECVGRSVEWEKIEPLPEDAIRSYASLKEPEKANIKQMLSHLVVVKLNGGLGTSMGCTGPKSVIPVRNDLTFLDLTVQQIEHLNKTYDADVPLVLLNSFNTEEVTQKLVRKYCGFRLKIYTFMQSRYLRINKESLLPIAQSMTDDNAAWYPAGHGDFYRAFNRSGLLQFFINEGRKFVFLSNIDNLCATVDLNILNLILDPTESVQPSFVLEVTAKTTADIKGGTLIQYEDHIRVLDIAQVPKAHVEEFKNVEKFKIFNTNNLWIKLESIQELLEMGEIDLDIIVNCKHLDNGLDVIQLETAADSAMKYFDGSIVINVPRSRFLPVKNTSDLLLVMSNLYSLSSGRLIMNPKRAVPTVPLVNLCDSHFSNVGDCLARFATIPDILELEQLTISGDVTFGKDVTLKGNVNIIANPGDRIDIPAGALLESAIVSGNLRIIDH